MLLLAVLVWSILFPMATAWGQTTGFYVTPSFSVSEVYDDNIFSRTSDSRRESDFITRFIPAVQAGYQSVPLTVLGRYSLNAEVFARHQALNNEQARHLAALDLRYIPLRPLTFSANASYTRTQTPGELNPLTGIEAPRSRAESFAFSPSIGYQLDPLTSISGQHSFTRNKQRGGVSNDTNTSSINLQRRFGRQDSGTITYSFRHFQFRDGDASGSDSSITHATTLTWSHELTPLTSLSIQGGARFTEGAVDPEVSVALQHKLRQGQLSLTYARSQTTAIGLAQTIDTESASITASHQPFRFLEISITPAFFRNERQDFETRVYSLRMNASYQLTKWISLVGSYQFSFQEGIFSSAAGGTPGQEILRNIVSVQLVASFPSRVY